MNAKDEIRNIRYELPTGDFIDFEVLHNGEWKAAQLADTAVQVMRSGVQSDRQTFDANLERIVAAAKNRANSTPAGEKIKLGSYDL